MQSRAFQHVGLLVTLMVVLSACGGDGGSTRSVAQTPEYLNQAPDVAYVGSDRCRGCHMSRSATYHDTGMGRSYYPLTPTEVVEDFTDANEVELPGTGLRYRMIERDGRYYQQQFMTGSAGQPLALDEREMQFVIGSGNHARSYITTVGDRLYQMPICWYPAAQLWDVCPGYEFNNDHFSREISMTCVFCHNGRMELEPGATNAYREPVPHGIGCERCHGPGELHVERWNDPTPAPPADFDRTIVNPRRLPPARRLEVCAQCHLGDSKATERVARAGTELADYRPGLPLTDTIMPLWLKQVSEREFGLSAQLDRLMRSRCFVESDGGLECLSCHDPHVSVYHEDRPAGQFRDVCLQCHALETCPAPPQERESTTPADDCVQCHMRKAEADDQRHATFTDHWIRRDIAREAPRLTELEMVPVFPQAFAALSEAEQAFYRGRADQLESLDLPPGVRDRMWSASERELRDAATGGMDTADAWFFLGKSLQFQRRWADAQRAFATALERDPLHRDAAFNQATTLLELGRVDEATPILFDLVQRNPDDVGALAELGRCAFQSRRADAALTYYDRALALDPSRASLHKNRAVSLASLGRYDEAYPSLERALILDPDNPELWDAYGQLSAQLGRSNAAAEAGRILGRLSR